MIFEKRFYRHTIGCHTHAPNRIVEPVDLVFRSVQLHLRGPVAELELELLFDFERLGVDAIERRRLVPVGRSFVTAVGNRPHLIVAIHYQRGGLDTHDQFIDNLISFSVDFQNTVLVRPAICKDVFAVLHHLLRRTRFVVHVCLDVPCNLVGLGIDDIDARIPYLRHIGFFVR